MMPEEHGWESEHSLEILWMRSGRRYSSYLALQTVRRAADSANKHDHDVTNDSVLRHN